MTSEVFKIRSGSSAHLNAMSPLQHRAHALLHHGALDRCITLTILVNCVLILVETDATAARLDDKNKDSPLWLQSLSTLVLFTFLLDLLLRLYVMKYLFFKDLWNVFDASIVAVDCLLTLLSLMFGKLFPISLLRLTRLFKLARISKILRRHRELALMIAALAGSLRSMFWGFFLLFGFMLAWAVIGVQIIHPINLELTEEGLYERLGCERCPRAYESVFQAFLTMWQQIVAGDSWGYVSIPMMERYPGTVVFFIPVLLSLGMAVMNLIFGLVVNAATAASDDMNHQIKKELDVQRNHMSIQLHEMCVAMDEDGSGELSHAELVEARKCNQNFNDLLSGMGINPDEMEILWTILDPDRDGAVTIQEFITQCCTLKDSDTTYMLAYIKYYITVIRQIILERVEELAKQMRHQTAMLNGQGLCPEAQKELAQTPSPNQVVVERHQKDKADRDKPDIAQDINSIHVTKFVEETNNKMTRTNASLESRGLCSFTDDEHRRLLDFLDDWQAWKKDLSTGISRIYNRLEADLSIGDHSETKCVSESLRRPGVPKRTTSDHISWPPLRHCCQAIPPSTQSQRVETKDEV